MSKVSNLLLTACVVLIGVGCEPPAPKQPNQSAGNSEQAEPITPQKAEAGIGKSSQRLDRHSDAQKIISGPAAALFKVKERMAFEIQIPQAMGLFKATNGRLPKSHEEFMTMIIEANRIPLPELQQGAEYKYNVEKGELWVYPVEGPDEGTEP